MSASINRVLKPALANEIAIFADVVDFPSPGCTDVKVITFKSQPLNWMLVRMEL